MFFMNHFQDVGLYDARASVNIPVLGLGETSLLHACTLGRKLGLLAINHAFIPTHADQVRRYGLEQRVAGIRAVNATMADWMEAFASAAKKAELEQVFEREARRLIDAGADVIVPTGGIPDDAVRRTGRPCRRCTDRQRRDRGPEGRRDGREAERLGVAVTSRDPAFRLRAAVR